MDNTFHTAFVSGASRGIGKAIAERLASSGINLFLTCHTKKEELDELSDNLHEKFGITALSVSADASSYPAMEDAIKKALDFFGSIDIAVNNAGISKNGLLTDMNESEWDQVIDTDLKSIYITTRLLAPGMVRRRKGRILNISSMWGEVGSSCEAAYSAAKGGVNALTRSLAKELAPENVAVNALSCGVIDTDMNRIYSEEERAALCSNIPAGRFARPEEVAEAAYHIISMPSYLTGQVIRMDGGFI